MKRNLHPEPIVYLDDDLMITNERMNTTHIHFKTELSTSPKDKFKSKSPRKLKRRLELDPIDVGDPSSIINI
jgi:hypothetical protein